MGVHVYRLPLILKEKSSMGPVSRKSRNLTGHFRVWQFPLYLKNREDLSRNTSQLFLLPCKKQAVGSFTNGFSGPKSFRDLRETGPCCYILYFRIPHNTLCLPPKFCINNCFQMLLGTLHIPKSIWKQWFMQYLGGKRSVLWGIRK